jgi:hypothetical protein
VHVRAPCTDLAFTSLVSLPNRSRTTCDLHARNYVCRRGQRYANNSPRLEALTVPWLGSGLGHGAWEYLRTVFREHGLELFVKESPLGGPYEPADGQARIPVPWVHWTKRDEIPTAKEWSHRVH